MKPRSMPTVTVYYLDTVPDELEAGIRQHVDAELDLLPSWVAEVDVNFTTDSEDVPCAQMRPHPDYRRAKLTIGPDWVNCSTRYRTVVIRHEFMHVQLAPLHAFAVRLLDLAGRGNDALDSELRAGFRTALEQTTVDLEALATRLIARGDDDEPLPLSEVAAPAPPLMRGTPRAPGPAISRTTNDGAEP